MNARIVIGLTDAPVAARVLDWAAERAADRRQGLRLVSVVGGAVGVVGEARLVSEILVARRDELERAARPLRERGIDVEVSVDRGDPVEKLVAASADAAMLVIGSDYRGPGGGRARGAHGIRIVSAATCPVVVVPDIEVAAGRAGIVVGIDGSEVSENAVAFAATEAGRGAFRRFLLGSITQEVLSRLAGVTAIVG